ncbi:hypothetical protein ACN4EK_22115 [Pantanalinema rosaneae CENA516]|uniref:hypothetical protein n=1 Tax=Pantanalinema rosaneae TaxID=1620701 RepID=UPI003D6E80E8
MRSIAPQPAIFYLASVTVGLTAIAVAPAQAAPVTYEFTVKVTQGSLAGKSFQGTLRYDDAKLQGKGMETIDATQGLQVCMNFFGRNYRETQDSNHPEFPKLVFQDGQIQTLDFWIEPGKRLNWGTLPGWETTFTRKGSAPVAALPCQTPSATRD